MIAFRLGVHEGEAIAANNEHLLTNVVPSTTKTIDIRITSYFDDLHAKHVINTVKQRTHEPIFKLQAANEKLDDILGRDGNVQNRSKQESVLVFMELVNVITTCIPCMHAKR